MSQCRRPHQVSRIEAYESSEQCSMGIRLMIIKLGIYNSAEELLIETRTTGSPGHICYQNRDQRASVTGVAVHMRRKGWGCKQGQGCIQSVSESGMRTGTHTINAEQSKKH